MGADANPGMTVATQASVAQQRKSASWLGAVADNGWIDSCLLQIPVVNHCPVNLLLPTGHLTVGLYDCFGQAADAQALQGIPDCVEQRQKVRSISQPQPARFAQRRPYLLQRNLGQLQETVPPDPDQLVSAETVQFGDLARVDSSVGGNSHRQQ